MSLKTVQKNFRFSEQEDSMLQELVQLEKLNRMIHFGYDESDVSYLNQSKVVTTLIKMAHRQLISELSESHSDELKKLGIHSE